MEKFINLLFLCVSAVLISCANRVDYTREMVISNVQVYSETYPDASILVSRVPLKNEAIECHESENQKSIKSTPKVPCWLAVVDTNSLINGPRDIILLYYDTHSGKVEKYVYFGFMPTIYVEMEYVKTPF